MVADKIFRITLILSIAFHAVIFYRWPGIRSVSTLKRLKRLEVTYSPLLKAPPDYNAISQRQKKARPPSPSIKTNVKDNLRIGDRVRPSVDPKEEARQVNYAPGMKERQRALVDESPGVFMRISHNERDMSHHPSYLDYYNAVRSNIYKTANANKPYYLMEGEVRIVFTLLRDGSLGKISVLKDRSTRNMILLNHALISVKRAAPFAPFAESMKEDHLTLRLTISFER